MRPIRILAVAALMIATPLLAADLGAFRDWADSPQGFFLTRAERLEWQKVTTESEARTFVDAFLARRGPEFATLVAERAAMADAHLTLGKTPGSHSLRGKVVILFGQPATVYLTDHAKGSTHVDNPVLAGALSNAWFTILSDPGQGSAGSRSSSGNTVITVQGIRTYTLTFSGDALAKIVDRKDVVFVVDADAATGRDEWASRSAGKEAEELFELAARASIAKR